MKKWFQIPPPFRKYVFVLWLLVIGPILFLFLLVTATSFGLFGELPTFEELENPNSNLASEVYSADQKTLGKYYIQNRVNIHYKDLSPNLINALKATVLERIEAIIFRGPSPIIFPF